MLLPIKGNAPVVNENPTQIASPLVGKGTDIDVMDFVYQSGTSIDVTDLVGSMSEIMTLIDSEIERVEKQTKKATA